MSGETGKTPATLRGIATAASVDPVRVLIVISNLEFGGAQRQVVELANNMDSDRFDVHICCLSDYMPLSKHLSDAASRLHVIDKKFKFDATVVPRLARLIADLRTDIVHAFLFDAEIAARLAGRLAGVKAIVASERNTDYHLKKRQLVAYRLTRSVVDLVIANSNAGADFNSRTLGLDRGKYRVVYNGVDVSRFSPREAGGTRRELGIGGDEKIVGMFASLKQQKNHPLLLDAAKEILHRIPGTRFLFVGDMLHRGMHGSDEYKSRVDRLVDVLGIRDRCLFLGNREDVTSLYCACDVTVLPSLFEGTPNVLLESMACGVPVVATNVSDNLRIVPDGHAGFLVPLGDPGALAGRICDVLSDDDTRRRMGAAARDWVCREFSTRALARNVEAIYLDLIRSRRGGEA